MESFFGTLKTELVHQLRLSRSRYRAARAVRLHRRLLQSAADPLRYRLHHPGAGRPEIRITRCPLFRGKVSLADRQFFGHALWLRARDTGADLLWRVKHNLRLPRQAVLADGSYLRS